MRWPIVVIAVSLITQMTTLTAQTEPVSRVVVSGTIELGLAPYVKRAVREANERGAPAIILDIDTFGGRVDAAQQIVVAVSSSEIPVYAIVSHNAWSAGAMIALAADSIFMTPGSSIGAATPVSGAGEKAPEKIVSAMRGEFRALAERRGLDPRIAEAMVDESIEIEGVVEEGKLLTLTGQEAIELGIADGEVEGVVGLLSLLDLESASVETVQVNWAENIVRFLSNPVLAPILLSLGVLGLVFEIKTPTFGFAGLVGLLCLGAFFGSHLIIGLAGWEEIIILGIGVVAVGIEVFVIPGFGIAGIIGLLCIGVATFMSLIGSIPTGEEVAEASGILIVTAAIIGVVIAVILKYLPATSRGGGIFLKAATDKASGYIAEPARDDLIGVVGIAVTDLRPSGTAQLEDERLDVVSDTGFVAKGSAVRVIRSEGYRHIVEPIEGILED